MLTDQFAFEFGAGSVLGAQQSPGVVVPGAGGPVICLAANALTYSGGGGHVWAYLNWALALRAVGCRVVWLECADELAPADVEESTDRLRSILRPFGLAGALTVVDTRRLEATPAVDDALAAEALIDLAYLPASLARRFRRSVLVDLDPGLTQLWASSGELDIGGHDLYATVGEGVAAGTASVPDCGISWLHVPPCVALDHWPCTPPVGGAAYTTITHWWESGTGVEFDGEWLDNSKRAGFESLIGLPGLVAPRLELALGGLDDADERVALTRAGWSVREAGVVAGSVSAFASYVRGSRGEFSAAKPSYVAMRTGWFSDRTVCYLATGRPVVIEDTGGKLGRGEPGLVRFTDLAGAVSGFEAVEAGYADHCAGARALAEREFDGARTVTRVLEWLL